MTRADRFELFVGIDWSGAKGPHLAGIQIAACEPGQTAPQLERPGKGKHWTRQGVLDWLVRKSSEKRLLVGMDYSFALPFEDEASYFPGVTEGPGSAFELWDLINQVAGDAADFYAGPFVRDQDGDWFRFFNSPWHKGDLFRSRRRVTDEVCRAVTAPTSPFNCVGPAAVGMGALAGMRFLKAVTGNGEGSISVWPFQGCGASSSVIVEAFPRFVFKRVGADPNCWKDKTAFADFLSRYRTEPISRLPETEDEADAIAISVGLRQMCALPDIWAPGGMIADVARREGWIFGVGCANP